MAEYAAFIGHQPHLSLAELAATVPGFSLKQKVGRDIILFESTATLDDAFLSGLGGTVILAEGVATPPRKVEELPELLTTMLMPLKGKVTFSVRSFGVSPKEVKNLYRDTKALLKKRGKPSRYVGNETTPAISIVLRQNDVVGPADKKKGYELCVIRLEDFFWVGVTVGAQDVESYTKRDMKKPVRDTTVGLLPPKLAQILINLGSWVIRKKPGMILDPFCGTGVIPMECLIRGIPVLASDKSEKAVSGCQKNLEWARKHFDIKKSDVPARVWKQDALKQFVVKEPVELIVTETTLGPALTKRPTSKDVQKLKAENEKIQEGFLKNISSSLPGVSVVCTWPVWYSGKTPIMLEKIWKVIDACGFEPVLPPTIEIVGGRMSLLYRRPDQHVGREIVLLRSKKR